MQTKKKIVAFRQQGNSYCSTAKKTRGIHGLGKVMFDDDYIQKCRELWEDIRVKSRFQATLCRFRKLLINMKFGTFRDGASFDGNMINLLKKSVKRDSKPHLPV
jgi:hypothetical protein